ncbi:hypothetical protein DV096_04630 [Bradymonadaceae bacterium TMQ3]|uniref:Outer membrane protein beta-barrel domain-containing protein n=1 Tax=Lujinxingia sediminis TaxID=2480984 RepID=A0ABY0CW43_9DELT|nr:hypothetical protein [Lujinxingia sediminis]RDV39854.1 hypothetical protein DV096_04630 [Bradymonadaceae bacterium TMQ3]RVU48102.1 hypothetical protein EA187_01300 [Lujinxingia sediminis]TXC77401.1 hypothetical protein FRC91_01305 [Bradymonadales bacterium TMQ1]
MTILQKTASLLAIIALCTLALASLAPTADAQCLSGLFGSKADKKATETEQRCTFHDECDEGFSCVETVCLSPEAVAERHAQTRATEGDITDVTPPPQDAYDGGADRVCGQNRRCRIERLKEHQRSRRHLDIARQQLETRRQAEVILARRKEDIHRVDKPWLAGFTAHFLGTGMLVGRTFLGGHLRAEATARFVNSYLYYQPDDPSLGSIDGNQSLILGTAQATYLPSSRWLSPYLSAGFSMGSGEFYNYSSGGNSDTQVTYHLVSAAVGFEAQFSFGLNARLGVTHGRVLYNQVSYAPGAYDRQARDNLRAYMNSDGLFSFDFTLGWAF